jgi:UDP-2,4-diacetamido-2,4,6-trideoxy-beta-L-altropyranose hydrolase
MAPIVLFRADATPQIGGGHIMRCLALAQRLGTVGAKCIFLVNPEAAHIAPALARSPHDIVSVGGADDAVAKARAAAPTGASLVIVDHYGVTATDETAFRQVAPNILVIDDLVDKPHDCDVLLNQNVNATRAGYAKLLPRDCRRLLGPRYALLRPEFAAARRASLAKRRQWDGRVRRVLLFLGSPTSVASRRRWQSFSSRPCRISNVSIWS